MKDKQEKDKIRKNKTDRMANIYTDRHEHKHNHHANQDRQTKRES